LADPCRKNIDKKIPNQNFSLDIFSGLKYSFKYNF